MEILNNANIVFVCLIFCIVTKGEDVAKAVVTRGRDIDGQSLIKLGRQLNKPFLTVIGMAITNLHQCGQWTQWSVCDTRFLEAFAIRNRTRKCSNINSSDSSANGGLTIESDMSICEGDCPTHYNLTTNGFCMKLYVAAKSHDDAEAQCQHDGGHLVNIDSDLKYADVKRVLTGFKPNIHIDGRRKDVKSPWEYKYASQTGYFKWYSGYPKTDSNYLCLALSNQRLFYNHLCTTMYAHICEIPR